MKKGLTAVLDLIEAIQAEVAKYSSHRYAIAGGCLRDAFFGQPIKDIDLVVAHAYQWDVNWPNTADYGPTGEFMAADSDMKVLGYPVQLIYRDGDVSAVSMYRYHSLSISNFFFADGLLQIDPQALKDFVDKRHTVNRSRWCNGQDEDRLETYIKKIQQKYPWEVRDA